MYKAIYEECMNTNILLCGSMYLDLYCFLGRYIFLLFCVRILNRGILLNLREHCRAFRLNIEKVWLGGICGSFSTLCFKL